MKARLVSRQSRFKLIPASLPALPKAQKICGLKEVSVEERVLTQEYGEKRRLFDKLNARLPKIRPISCRVHLG